MTDFENYKNEASVKNILCDTSDLSLEKLNIDDRRRVRLTNLLLKTAVVEKDSLEERILYYQIMNDDLFEELYKRYNDTIKFSSLNVDTCGQLLHILDMKMTKELHDEPVDCSISIIDFVSQDEPCLDKCEPLKKISKPSILSFFKRIFTTEM